MTVTANADGLRQRYGLDTQLTAQAGETLPAGAVKHLICTLEASRMVIGGGLIGQEPNNAIPVGSFIKSATFIVTEAFDSGTTATLDLGLAIADGTYTGGDEDGIDAAIAESAIDTAGKAVLCDGAMVGSTTASVTTVVLYPSYDVDTAVYTTGKGYLVIEYIPRPYSGETPK